MPLFEDEAQLVHKISTCSHVYHRECLTHYARSQIEQGKLPIKCPVPNCKKPLSEKNDLKKLLNGADMTRLQKFEWKMIRDSNPADYLECPNAACDYFFSRGNVKEIRKHDCPACGLSWCFKCNMNYHVGYTCAEYSARRTAEYVNSTELEEDRQLEAWARSVGAKRCARCKYWVHKNDGCDHMTCRCGYEFCYKCGGKYRECEHTR